VLESDASPTTVAPAPGSPEAYPEWSPDRVYLDGDTVSWQGEAFEAKWWTQDEEPVADADRPNDVLWRHLGPAPEESGDDEDS
jgi:chitinase